MSDLRLVTHAEHHPSTCARCSTHKGPFVDFGVTGLDGQLYLCQPCLIQASRLVGMVEPDEHARVQALLDDALEAKVNLQAEVEDLSRPTAKVVPMKDAIEYAREQLAAAGSSAKPKTKRLGR